MSVKEQLQGRRWLVAERDRLLSIGEPCDMLDASIAHIDALIDGVGDYRLRLVLQFKYKDCKTNEELADILNYSPRQVRRLLHRAIDVVESLC